MEDQQPYVNVKNLLKEFGEKPVVSTEPKHDDNTFRSVKDRLRVFDSRQDNNVRDSGNSRPTHHNAREPVGRTSSETERSRSNRSSSSLKENSATKTELYTYGNVMLKKVEKPVVGKWKNKTVPTPQQNKLSDLNDKQQNNVGTGLKKGSLPVADKWKAMKKGEEKTPTAIPPAFAIMKLRSAAIATNSARVSDLAKTFSPQIKLASNGERAEEQKVIGRVATTAYGTREIVHIRSSNLKSSAMELEELRKTLNKSTSVAKLIAERNKAAEANRSASQNVYGLPRDGKMTYGRPRSKSMGRLPNSHRRTKSMSSSNTKNSAAEGLNWDSAQTRRDSIDTLGGFSNMYWEDFKANNPTGAGGINTIWDLNLDDTSFFGRHQSCTALDVLSGGNDDRLLTSNSTLSDDSDGDYYYDNYGHSRYIQITLSSGGIVEKCEPVICMTMSDDSSGDYQSEFGMDISVGIVDSKHSTRKALMGARKFFFGGMSKRKNGPIEV